MEQLPQASERSKQPLSSTEASSLLWQEWKYRHDLFWQSLFRWGAAVITVSIVPYIKPDIIPILGRTILIFPILAGLLSLFSAWHISAEYARLEKVTIAYRKLLGEYSPEPIIGNNLFTRLVVKPKIGVVASWAFLFAFALLGVANGIVLNHLWIAQYLTP